MKKKILIIGNGAKEYALAKKLSQEHEIFVAPKNGLMDDFAVGVDLRENDINGLLRFAVENNIDMTIPVSQIAIKSDISSVFTANKQSVFAPTSNATRFIYDKGLTKKTLYKLHIPTPKFGIFEKENVASDYLKNQKIPFVIKTDENCSTTVLTSVRTAKNIINSIYIDKNNKAIIEDYVYGTSFSYYAITDGYKALPIGSSITYKHSLEGEGGQLTSGMGACAPNYKLTIDDEYMLMDNVIYPTLEYLEKSGNPYLGIIGINGIISDENKIFILGWQTYMNDCDAPAITENLDEDIYSLFESCIIGSFSDEKNVIKQKEQYSVSLVMKCGTEAKENTIKGLDLLDDDTVVSFYNTVSKNKYLEYEANRGNVLILTNSASTISRASAKVYNEAGMINFTGLGYRRDIAKPLII